MEAKLVELCAGLGISPASAVNALDALHSEIWNVLINTDARTLRRGDLLRIVHAAATTAIPTADLLEIVRSLSGAASASTAIAASTKPYNLPPRPAPRRHVRPDLESSIAKALGAGTVLIHGATGSGKTALALTTVTTTRPSAWVELRDRTPSAAASIVAAVVSELTKGSAAHDVVLDDLPTGDDTRALEGPLGRLRALQDSCGGRLLVTSSDRTSARIAAQLSLASAHVFLATDFSRQDIEAFLTASGCDEQNATNWSKILYISTSGHPQLVDARVAALSEAGFPLPDLSELLVPPPEIVDARAEARRIVAALPREDREMLARASLLLGRVPRSRLMAVARVSPPIDEPGHIIDRLTGPWLERTESDDLRVSPLLRSLGTETRGQEWSTAMHAGIALTFLHGRTVLASDVFDLATHAMLGKTAAPIVRLLPNLLQASSDVWKQIAETARPLAYIGVHAETSSPFPRGVETAAFRVFQLRIAIETGRQELVAPILARALDEFDAHSPDHGLGSEFFEVVFLWQILQKAGPLTLDERIKLSLRFAKAGQRVAQATRAMLLTGNARDSPIEWPVLSPVITMALVPVMTDADDLIELLDRIDSLDADDRRLMLSGFASQEAAALMTDRLWLGEAARSEPRWSLLASVLERLLTLTNIDTEPSLSDAVAALLIRVIDQNLDDTQEALVRADGFIVSLGRSGRLLAAKAKVLTRGSRALEALPLYEEALPSFTLGFSWRTDVLRDAGVAAGKVADWGLAAERFHEALSSTGTDMPLVRRLGLHFDYAIALYFCNRVREAVDCLGSATDLLLEDGQSLPPEPLVSVRQIGSQVVKTIMAELGSATMSRPEALDLRTVFGVASSVRELNWGDQTPATLDLFVLLMAELDLLLPDPPLIAARLAARLRASSELLVQSAQGDILTSLAVRTTDATCGAADAIREARALFLSNAERVAGRKVIGAKVHDGPFALPAELKDMIQLRLLSRIVPFLATGRHAELPIDIWRRELPADGSMAELQATLDDLNRMIDGTEDATRRIRAGNISWDQHLLAVMMAPIQRHLSVGDLLVSHVVAMRYLDQPKLFVFVEESFSAMITRAWLERCDNPTFLAVPNLSVPAIRNAAAKTPSGRPRIGAVLRAALGAVGGRVAPSVREAVRQFSA